MGWGNMVWRCVWGKVYAIDFSIHIYTVLGSTCLWCLV